MKISVITITLNAADFLNGAIDSVAAQNHPDVEHILVDGGSTDGTLDLIRGAAARNPRQRHLSGADDGISDAMNKGLEAATGEVVAFLHADDLYADPAVLSRVISTFRQHPSCVWLTGGIRQVGRNGSLLRDLPVRQYSYRRLLRSNIIFHPATFVRREALLQVGGFSPSLRYAMDYDLWLRLAKLADPVTCNDIFACFRVHRGSLSCRCHRAAFREEWDVRRRALGRRNPLIPLHFAWYLLKKVSNGSFIDRHAAEEQ